MMRNGSLVCLVRPYLDRNGYTKGFHTTSGKGHSWHNGLGVSFRASAHKSAFSYGFWVNNFSIQNV